MCPPRFKSMRELVKLSCPNYLAVTKYMQPPFLRCDEVLFGKKINPANFGEKKETYVWADRANIYL